MLREQVKDRFTPATDRAFFLVYSTPELLVSHLVDQRGHYFHGNLKKPSAWHPDRQDEAESLASVSMSIAQKIAFTFAEPLWDDLVLKAHQQRAYDAGAKYMVEVMFSYRNHGEDFDRKGQLRMAYPATKATANLAMHAVKDFLATFEHDAPSGAVRDVSAKGEDGIPIFTLTLHVPS